MALSPSRPDLVLVNARVITLDRAVPQAGAVAISNGLISWVGPSELAPRSEAARVIDCQGQALLPGFHDAHCHVFAYASSLLSVDCTPAAVASIADIKQAIRRRAAATPPGQWIRASGYSEFFLSEKRHPTRRDLDEAAPEHPVRLHHASGHACVLNSLALQRVGITGETPEPVSGIIERDLETGEPNGVLYEMEDFLNGKVPMFSEEELRRSIRMASRRFVSLGVTSVQDATPHNSPERFELLARLRADGLFRPRVTMMTGIEHLEGFARQGVRCGAGGDGLRLGPVKVILSMTTGSLHPPVAELRQMVRRAHDAGFPVAVHAVDAEAVEAAVDVLLESASKSSGGPARYRDRLEHCSECPPVAMPKLARLRSVIVTQPGFIYHSGARYLSDVPEERQPWLYRIGLWMREGLTVAASSDAPVTDPNPLVGIYSAVTRRAVSGERVGESEAVSAIEALRLYTLGGAYAAGQEARLGSISVGKLADLVLLDTDVTRATPGDVLKARAIMTIIGGEVVWEG